MTDSPHHDPDRIAGRLALLRRRALVGRGIRAFFDARGYLEVETPCAVPTPGEEVHLRVFRTEREHHDGTRQALFLHTSPEFAMKRIVAATGLPVFQLARVWRNAEGSHLHAPEFTMLEWYRPGATLSGLMDETEALLRAVLPPVVHRPGGLAAGAEIRIDAPFERLTMEQAFARHAGLDLLPTEGDAGALAAAAGCALRDGEDWEDLFFRLLMERVEPAIGRDRPTFLTHWPASQAALARRDPADPRTALRFELYAGGIELANAFEELTDPVEQRRRFMADRERRAALYGAAPATAWPMDEALLAALDHLPPCAGIALGFDRLVMLAAGALRIGDIQWMG
ncbi:tRNA synthetase class II (D K and N) [Gluconacetobacter diazotrophicus PA1 5]|uniref:Putative lysyl-tRNA synthetase n=1 Tax=Gluconacetobacter diazotrophicus (strain ATCC 49037 / DSM 5601 / CCUG 37298 / CIP 103539 / LMG 7603 / PAl5) TaxID=272568 RepID=A9H6E7_GLUDA|nr:EF-P lysine aminoacylase EpmA [Gluconacetobacter diazotrophicus]ACI51277.1 tRNA synthetase class II (D K and N) [Gluconacetobacter diazotrophicus PA1 5]TWB09825.1 lysyl-tRNA synthetase class 2 [Gluconacetobacter diazotrophicus]CAP54452.1 putative lysyl-tRNA synthetase [Gluconacetobacter diazotrophicus PA1 5]